MLRIASPFREKSEVSSLIEAGADEFYCGFLPEGWNKRYTNLEFERKGGDSNFTDLKELRGAVRLAHERNVPVFLTLNGLYVREQYPLLLDIVDRLDETELDGYIVADIGLLLTLRKRGLNKQLHISLGGTAFNREAVRFYQALGASRIILDRQVTIDEMRGLSEENPGIDFEIFILNTLCAYIDGFCTFLHSYGREPEEEISGKDQNDNLKYYLTSAYDPDAMVDACCLNYTVNTYNDSGQRLDSKKIYPRFYRRMADGTECGACAIFDIARTRVKSIKIVGRQLSSEIRLKSVKFIRATLDILQKDEGLSREEFVRKTQNLYCQTFLYRKECRGNNCYHPSVLFDGR